MVGVPVNGPAVAEHRVLSAEKRHRNVALVAVVDDERLEILSDNEINKLECFILASKIFWARLSHYIHHKLV